MPQRPVTDRPPLDRAPLDRALLDGRPRRAAESPPTSERANQGAGAGGGAAGDRLQYNQRLSALIEEAGFSHAGLARRVDQLGSEHGLDLRYDKTSVTRWLRGQQPRGATPALIAEVFTRRLGRRLTAQDLGLDACAPVYAGLEFAESPAEAVDIVASMWRKDTGAHSELRRIAFTPAGLVVPSRDWLIGRTDDRVARETPQDLGRHDAGRTGIPPQARRDGATPGGMAGGSAAGLPNSVGGSANAGNSGQGSASAGSGSAGAGAGAGEQAMALRGVPRVSRGDVAAMRAVGDLFRALDNAYGGGHARQALIRYLESEAEPMLRGRYNEAIGRALFGAVADLTRLAGWTSYDIGAHGLAQRYFVQSLRLAQAANDRLYGGYVLVTMSRQAVYLGHGREAVQLARVAQQGVGSTAPAAAQALMHAAEARGHGLLGDARSCTAALVRAERALQASHGGDELPGWARFFDEAQLADEFAHCYRDLQQWRPAAQHAERSLRLRPQTYARSRVFCRVVLATSRLGLGELDEACAAATEALRGVTEMRSLRAVEYLRDFARRLAPYRGNPSVRAFEEAARTAGVI
ncbi:regulator [Streptacidiphilus melanogenes]|uniref:regulator n=1 Tax=Streptacidiphilus melanogenes TaxID=411235 RepID=UPI000A40C57C|nr:regulator [Streptacidiphilus melanogenes]